MSDQELTPVPRVPRLAPRRQRAIPRTPLALAVMNLLHERSMHPYEMKVLMLQRGHERAVRLKEASLYDTVERLASIGFIAPIEVSRKGRRPERTVYGITQSGRDDLLIWLQQLISEPSPEYPNFAAALMFILALGKDGAITALTLRSAMLEADISRTDAFQRALRESGAYAEMLPPGMTEFPRLLGIEEEYAQAMRRAELAWVRQTVSELRDGTLSWPDLGEPAEIDQ